MMQKKTYPKGIWQFEQKSKYSIHRLRHQLAEDGCKESQVSLARSLLKEEVSSKNEKCENEKVAVHWLLRAAGQGYEEASDLLNECYRNGKGITSYNKQMVENCLNRTEKEKFAQQLGHQLHKLITYDVDEILTIKNFRERVTAVLSSEKKIDLVNNSSKTEVCDGLTYSKQKVVKNGISPTVVAVGDIVTSVYQVLEGESPNIFLTENSALNSRPKHKLLQWPSMVFYRVTNELLRIIYTQFVSLAMLMCALSFCVFAYIFSPQLAFFRYVVSLISLTSLIIMLFSAGYMISLTMQYYNFSTWQKVIRLFCTSQLECNDKYSNRTLFCFVVFLIATTTFLLSFPLNVSKLAHTDVATISVLLIYFLEKECRSQRQLRLISLALTLLISLCKTGFIREKWTEVYGTVICWKVTNHIEIKLNGVSVFYSLLIFLYLKIARSDIDHQWYRILLPHFISLILTNVTVFLLEESHPTEFVHSVILLVMTIALSQYFPVCVAISMCYIAKSALIGIGFWNIIVLIMISLMFIAYSFMCHYFSVHLNKSHKLKVFVLSASLFGILFFFGGTAFTDGNNTGPVLTWDQYQSYCYQPAWEKSNMAEVEAACLHLIGSRIGGEGSVHSVNIRSVSNPLKSIISLIPSPMARVMKCALGMQYHNCQQEASSVQYERCLLYRASIEDECHLEEWNMHKFEIVLSMVNTYGIEAELFVDADDICKNFIMNLQNGDDVQIIGILDANPGGVRPRLKLQTAVCKTCNKITVCDYSNFSFAANWPKIVQFYIKFFFSPLISYTVKEDEHTYF